jgi:hypothetical protein
MRMNDVRKSQVQVQAVSLGGRNGYGEKKVARKMKDEF